MVQLIFATSNANKVKEVKNISPKHIEILSLQDIDINITIEEPFDTLEENALQKSQTIFNLTQANCFSEDSGLEVASLAGAPGVKSARYAGEPCNDMANIQKILTDLSSATNREAQFKTIISLIWQGEQHLFEGICKGTITTACRGNYGFGYDPIFIPEGSNKTFAEMTLEEKSQFSHRKKAMQKLISFLNKTTL